jgi:hypothetical protein
MRKVQSWDATFQEASKSVQISQDYVLCVTQHTTGIRRFLSLASPRLGRRCKEETRPSPRSSPVSVDFSKAIRCLAARRIIVRRRLWTHRLRLTEASDKGSTNSRARRPGRSEGAAAKVPPQCPACFRGYKRFANSLNFMARPKRFELLTPRFVVWCSIQLSYGRIPGHTGNSPAIRARPSYRLRAILASAGRCAGQAKTPAETI